MREGSVRTAEDDDADTGGGGPLEDVDLELGEAGRNWTRPALPPIDPRKDDIGEGGRGCEERADAREGELKILNRLRIEKFITH